VTGCGPEADDSLENLPGLAVVRRILRPKIRREHEQARQREEEPEQQGQHH
jgi:hypothetical protein